MFSIILVSSFLSQAEVPGAKPLAPADGNARSVEMVAGIDRFLMRKTEEIGVERRKRWEGMAKAHFLGVGAMRKRLADVLGMTAPPAERLAPPAVVGPVEVAFIGETEKYEVLAVRWECGNGLIAEGIEICQKDEPTFTAIAIPDAGQTPEMICGVAPGLEPASQFGRLLAEAGADVMIPALIDRDWACSGNAAIGRSTNQPHREWIYRQAYQTGRHLYAYEVMRVLAAGRWLNDPVENESTLVLVGHGEGALIGMYAAAVHPHLFTGVYLGGSFQSRNNLWGQPIWRNAFGLLKDFDDPEVAALVFPSIFHVDNSSLDGRGTWRSQPKATPGIIENASSKSFETVVRQMEKYGQSGGKFTQGGKMSKAPLSVHRVKEASAPFCPGLEKFLEAVGEKLPSGARSEKLSMEIEETVDPRRRQKRLVENLTEIVQREYRASERVRKELWKDVDPKKIAADKWHSACASLREKFRKEVIGEFEDAKSPPNPRARKLKETANWVMHEVVLDVWPEVFAWGYLLLPKDLKPGEKRPVVVCQHGLEGLPEDCVTDDPKSQGFQYYQAFAAKLADRGFITFVPHNPYRGGDKFRVLQRKANPLGRSLFSIIVAQHEVITDWLAGLPFVDPARIGFYGLSYGGKTAMRVPALVDRYCLSICSADFNDWIRKNVVVDDPHSYMFTGEYEMPEWNLGRTFNYAEMAALIAPRPFMVERGHYDGVAPDEWVAYEYAKVRRLYAELKIPERTEIEWFLGPHRINGVGTFDFLHKHLKWPKK
jgi:hypothetical protein